MKAGDRFGLDGDDDDFDDVIGDNVSLIDLLAAQPRDESMSVELRDWGQTSSRDSHSDHFVSAPVYDKFSWKRLFVFMGPGFLVSTSFLDPGNFDTDIQAGARFEYELIWVLISATMLGLLLQNLAAKLGVVTGLNLAEICAHQYPGRLKYVLWCIAEITIIASDIPEVIGTAFALRFLFNFPLWFGVIVTSASVMLFLMVNLFGDRNLEFLIAILIAIVAFCFVGELVMSSVQPLKLLRGVIPTFNLSAIYAATSLIGSVVMPHNIFLHSALVQSRSVRRTLPALREACFYNLIESFLALTISLLINIAILSTASMLPTLTDFIVSAAEFYPNADAGLLSAPSLLQKILKGKSAPTLFAVALLASGQSSTMTGTYAGQFVMEGFIQLKMSKWARAIITRLLAILPSLTIALIAGEKGADGLIILSQVLLSVLLPFSLIPLLKLTSCPHKMGAFVNSTATKTVITVLGTGVTFANCMMVGGEIVPLLANLSGVASVPCALLVASVAIAYLALLGYLLITPISNSHSPLDIKPS